MTLEEAIMHCEEKACGNSQCALEHKQLAKWLKELRILKSLPSNLDEAAHSYSESDEPLYSPGHRFHWDSDSLFGKQIETTFKAGAEWMAGQGVSMVITDETEWEEVDKFVHRNCDGATIIQIRKKD